MLREGLASEFPFAKRAIDRLASSVRSAQVSREAPLWAAISAFGASWAVGAIGQVFATGVRVVGLRDPASWLSGGLAILGYAFAIAVALRAGGRRALTWYFGLLAVQTATQIALALPGFLTFCERSGTDCSPLRLVAPYAYLAAGIVVSPAAVRVIRSGPTGTNVFLNGAGAFALLAGLGGLAFFFGRPQDAVSISAMSFGVSGGAAFLAGVVLRLRSPRPAPAGLLAGAIALTWLALSGPFIVSTLRNGAGPQPAAVYGLGLVEAFALLLGWFMTDLAQRARTTAAA
jgi:hypothetical protein